MSESWYLGCDACDVEAEDGVNHGRPALVALAEHSWPLHLCVEAGFDLCDTDMDRGGPLGHHSAAQITFAAQHAKCNAFRVRCEYTPRDPHHQPRFPKVKGLDAQPCRLCADRGLVPCPECKPDGRTRLETDAAMRRKQRMEHNR